MPNTRYTVRLPPALDALVQERILTTRTPFTVLVREALSAYLADLPPPGTPTPADSADTLRELQAQLAAVTARVEMLELALTAVPTPRRQDTARIADTPPPDADSAADTAPTPPPPGRGQRKLTPRQVRALRDKHRRGVPVPALMEEYSISRASVFRYLQSEKR
jgi:hypothetical protein